MVNQLIEIGFTTSQAQYGVDNCKQFLAEKSKKIEKRLLTDLYLCNYSTYRSPQYDYIYDWTNLTEKTIRYYVRKYSFFQCQSQYERECSIDFSKIKSLEAAKYYTETDIFSYNGLVDQLETDGFTYEDSEYGATNCDVDWNEQALKKAELYLSTDLLSYNELIEQLEDDGFLHEEAQYGADNCQKW